MATTLLQIGIIYFLGHLFAYFFKKYKIPDVLLFMLIGIIIGPALMFTSPEDFGTSGQVLSTLALLVILFQSGTTLDMKSLAEVSGIGSVLTIITFVVTGALAFLAALTFTDSWQLALVTGIILAGTSSAVVIPMSEALGLNPRMKNILLLESSLTDVLCIVLTLAFTNAFLGEGLEFGSVLNQVFLSFAIAILIGGAAGLAWAYYKQKIQAQFATIAFAIVVYSLVELLGFSGPIAVMSMGFALANAHRFQKITENPCLSAAEAGFYSELGFVLKTFFFIYLGISMRFENWLMIPLALVFVVVLYILRALIAKVLLRRESNLDLSYITLLIPKGLAAAVLAGIPMQSGMMGAEVIPHFVFPCILVSIVLTSALIPIVGKKYGST